MTEREVLKLALEALQKIYIAPEHEEYIRVWWPACEQAIPAIKEALAQPEQEPVAWFSTLPDGKLSIKIVGKPTEGNWGPLYATPPQRTWVGLTDDEIDQGLLRSDYAFKTAEAWRAGVVFAMTKLKEKNT